MTLPVCTSDPALWTSREITDHILARKGCAQCHRVQACVDESLAIAGETAHHGVEMRAPDGTWGGLLWINGVLQVPAVRVDVQPEGPQQEVA